MQLVLSYLLMLSNCYINLLNNAHDLPLACYAQTCPVTILGFNGCGKHVL